jgi:hypothetical protein
MGSVVLFCSLARGTVESIEDFISVRRVRE